VTNSTDAPYEVWTQCKPRANDENMVKELKRGFLRRPFWEVKKKDSI